MTKTVPMSRFIQNYNQHLSEAEATNESIVLEQRAGRPTWILETESRVHDSQSAAEFLAAALKALIEDPSLADRFPDALASTLPWTHFLPEDERRAFATDATNTLRACAAVGRYAAFATLIEDWRNTAEVWSDPGLAQSLAAPVDELLDEPVAVD